MKIIRSGMPKASLLSKHNYEPLLLECLNGISYFVDKSGGIFTAPKSESSGQCDAISAKGTYDIDFKLLISQEGAQNFNETRLTEKELYSGITISQPSKATMRGVHSLQFPFLWAFFVTGSFCLNENSEIVLVDKSDTLMERTVLSLNRIIDTKKHLLVFHPSRLLIESACSDPISVLQERAKALLLLSEARFARSPEYDTYYALLMNNEMVVLSADITVVDSMPLTSLKAWRKPRPR